MRLTVAGAVAVAFLVACGAPPRATVHPHPSTTAPVYFGGKPVRFDLTSHPLGFDPDGNAEWLVVARFFDARGNVTRIMANSDLDWISRDGYVQWQNRMRFGQPSAIVKTYRDGPITLLVRCNKPSLGTHVISTDTRYWRLPRVAAAPLGAFVAQIGWFPRTTHPVRIARMGCTGTRSRASWVVTGDSSFRDPVDVPGEACRYTVTREAHTSNVSVRFPNLPTRTSMSNASGTGMWLYFSTNPLDSIYYGNLDPQAIVNQAVRARLHYVELRTAYGAFWQITPQARATIDAIIDGLAAHRIVTIGWTVPRDDAFDDIEASVRTAYYRTAKGTPFAGIAVDLERGEEFMGGSPDGLDALWKYVRDLRRALGPQYLIVSTIEDPYLEHLTQQSYPYAQIARYTGVLQPMTYWRMLQPAPFKANRVPGIMRASYAMVSALAMRSVAIGMGGQTAALGANGAPPPSEINDALRASKAAGAIGVCFFAWDATSPPQWGALSAYHWR